MKTIIPLIRPLVLSLLVVTGFVATTLAQEVQIPDPGLNAAIRRAEWMRVDTGKSFLSEERAGVRSRTKIR
jgi:hypothetical protein